MPPHLAPTHAAAQVQPAYTGIATNVFLTPCAVSRRVQPDRLTVATSPHRSQIVQTGFKTGKRGITPQMQEGIAIQQPHAQRQPRLIAARREKHDTNKKGVGL